MKIVHSDLFWFSRWTDMFSQLSKGQNLKLLPTMPHDEASEGLFPVFFLKNIMIFFKELYYKFSNLFP